MNYKQIIATVDLSELRILELIQDWQHGYGIIHQTTALDYGAYP